MIFMEVDMLIHIVDISIINFYVKYQVIQKIFLKHQVMSLIHLIIMVYHYQLIRLMEIQIMEV